MGIDKKINVPEANGFGKYIAGAIFVVVCIWILVSSIFIVNAGEKGILLTWGKAEDITYDAGLHFKMPIAQDVIYMNIQTLKEEADASAASKDLQIVSTRVALNYHIDANNANTIYKEIGMKYKTKVIDPAIQESVKASTAQYTAEELITKREIVKQKIKDELRTRLAVYNLIQEDISITNFEFSAEFNNAIEAKVTAEQNALKARNDLERIKVEAEQKIAQANGEANATLTKAIAEAQAIRITAEALKENPQLVQLESVKKWDGKLPVYSMGGTPLITLPTVAP